MRILAFPASRAAALGCLVVACAVPGGRVETPPASLPLAEVAITLDDLPFAGLTRPGDTRLQATERILAALQQHHAPAVGFVVCDRIRPDEPVLARWLAAGMELGNHSERHKSADEVELAQWAEDVRRCDLTLQTLLSHPVRYFRYPFLQQGRTPALRGATAAVVRALDETAAPVSIDTADWQFSTLYVEALQREDARAAAALRSAYVAHVVAAARHYQVAARERFGRDVSHVLLLHANALNADALAEVLAALERGGFHFGSLARALEDPVYRQPDAYAGPVGMSWLYRLSPAAPERWQWDHAQEQGVRVRFGSGTEALGDELSIRRIAERIYLVVDAKPWPANSLVAEMPDRSLVLVSTPYESASTRALVAWLKAAFDDPPMVDINTHFHLDGTGGNSELKAAGIPTYGSDLTVEWLLKRGEAMRQETVAALEGDPAWQGRIQALALVPPTNVFDAKAGLVLERGGERVVVHYPGAGHSPDNEVVWFPAQRVLFGGCLVIGRDRLGNLADADLAQWPASVESLRAFDAQTVVPGHGTVSDASLLDHTLSLLQQEAAKGSAQP